MFQIVLLSNILSFCIHYTSGIWYYLTALGYIELLMLYLSLIRLFILFFLQLTAAKRLILRRKPWRLPRQLRLVQLSSRRLRRSEHQLHSIGQRHWRKTGILNIPESVQLQGTSWTNIKFLNIHWPPSQQWRRSRIITPLFSLLTFVQTRKRSRMPWRRCMIFRPRKWTL